METIYEAAARAEGFRPVEGVLDVQSASLRTAGLRRVMTTLSRTSSSSASTGCDPVSVDQRDRLVRPAQQQQVSTLQKVETVNGRPRRAEAAIRASVTSRPSSQPCLVMECGKDR